MLSTHEAAFDISDAHPWILYLNPQLHAHESAVIQTAGLETYVLVQDIRHAPRDKPEWLTNLPILLDTKQRKAYRGSSCLQKLLTLKLPVEYSKRLQKKSAWPVVSADE